MNTKKLVLVIVILILFIYLRYWLSVSGVVKIVQLSLVELSPSILMQKNPIVIEERLVNPISLLQTVFKYMYIWKTVKAVEDGDSAVFKQNNSRFLIATSNADGSSVQIINPKYNDATNESPYIDIKLHANMSMILPFKWWYRFTTPKNISTIRLDDIISLTFGRIF